MELPDPPKTYVHAGFGIRLGAYIIDFIILIPFAVFNVYNSISLKSLALGVIALILTSAYKPLLEFYYGATLGKKAVNLKVVDEDYNPINLRMALERYLPWLISIAITFYITFVTFSDPAFADIDGFIALGEYQQEQGLSMIQWLGLLPVLIAVLVILFNKKKQGLHDQFAGTFCIYTDR